MRSLITVAALGLAAGLAGHAVAQEAPSSTPAPTPEAAARFIDTVIGNGVAKVGYLDSSTQFSGAEAVESSRTSLCETTILYPTGSYGRTVIKIDWRNFVGANSFFAASITDRWAARLLAQTTRMLTENYDVTKVNEYSIKNHIGVVVEPGTEELKDRLIRAMEFYGKSCAPKLDGPF